ncbi:hypothetical protein ONE63_010985 [Megalurothrips usitatus]|uniref:Uncharacterized protein n=1 Tax=Megalurothrips usitatus TaxID=439358 RepID=A0AAV7XIU6_9NEOP|nr:hypothetical protein ONE63_010985 [Megalurothrips usitatus]
MSSSTMLPLGAFESSLRGKGAVGGVAGLGLGPMGPPLGLASPAAPAANNGIHKSCTGRAHGHGIQKNVATPPARGSDDSDDTDSGQESLSANASSCDSVHPDQVDAAPPPAAPAAASPPAPELVPGTVKRVKRVQRVTQHVTLRRAVSSKLPLTATDEPAAAAASPAKGRSTIPIRREASMSLDRTRKASLPNGTSNGTTNATPPGVPAGPPKTPLQRKASGPSPGAANGGPGGPLARKASMGSLSRGPSTSNLALAGGKKPVVATPVRPKPGAAAAARKPSFAFTNVVSWEELHGLSEAQRPGGGLYKSLDQLLEVSVGGIRRD